MKKILCILLSLSVLLLFSCNQEGEKTATMRIILEDVKTSRLIAPENYPLEIDTYYITGHGPDGKRFDIHTGKTSATIENVVIGEWTIKVQGLNEYDNVIVEGSKSFTLSNSNNSVTITLDTLYGEGDLSVKLKWKDSTVENPRLDVSLTRQSGEKETLNAEISGNTASIYKENLASGSYIFQAQLFDSDTLISGLTEAVRIVDSQISSAELDFVQTDFILTPGSISLIDKSGIPVRCNISGIDGDLKAGPHTVTLVPERDADLEDLTVNWYIDGSLAGSGRECELTFDTGVHRLDAVAYTSKLGSYGSTGLSVTVLDDTDFGIPGNARVIDSTAGLDIGRNNYFSFLPDGRLMAFSSVGNTAQVFKISASEFTLEKEYTGLEFQKGYVASALAVEDDESGMFNMLICTDDDINTYHYYMNPETLELNYVNSSGDTYSSDMWFGNCKITKVLPDIAYDTVYDEFLFVGIDNPLTVEDDLERPAMEGKVGAMIGRRPVDGINAHEDFALLDAYPVRDFDKDATFDNRPSSPLLDTAAFAISPNSEQYAIIDRSQGRFVTLNEMTFDHTDYYGNFRYHGDSFADPDKYIGANDMIYKTNDIAVIAGRGFIATVKTYKDKGSTDAFYKEVSGADFSSLAMNPVTKHIYALDESDDALYVYTVSSNGDIQESAVIDTVSSYSDMEVSPDGKSLILYNSTGASVKMMLINVN